MTYLSIISDSDKVAKVMETEFDFEEYDILFTNAHSRVLTALEEKVKDLTERENQRIAKEKAEAEALAEKAKNELQSKRLTSIIYCAHFGNEIDLTVLWTYTDEEFENILKAKKDLFDANQKAENERKEKEEADKKAQEEKEEEQKEAIFEIRSKRLIEIGMIYSDEHDTFWTKENEDYILLASEVKNEDTIGFENLLNDSKSLIEKSKQKALEVIAQQEADLKASKADAEKLNAENKARVKKFAKDKKTLSGLIATVDYPDSVFVLENEESKEALNSFIVALADFKKEWIGNIEKL
ncbi:hypothetical protein D3C85_757790 [compost metagenome]